MNVPIQHAEPQPAGRLALELCAASFVALFQELALIRWLPGQVRVLAYFPNLVLLSAFLGLGLGCLRAGRRTLVPAWPALLLVVVAAGAAMNRIAFTARSTSEHLFLLYYDLPPGAPVVSGVELPIVASFVLSAISFVPLGQLVAERLDAFRARGRALAGYGWDIGGSLLGVLAFALVSFSGAFPVAWFGLVFALGWLFAGSSRRARATYALAAGLVLLVVASAERADSYSPYYALRVDQKPGLPGYAVLANGSLHQFALPLRRDDQGLTATQEESRRGYHEPYRQLRRPPRRALVVGAGTGNDVAVLLDEGALHVDAVEIDPGILHLGRWHPNAPYASPRVRTHATDARTFLDRSRESYDVIVFGTLDSMTRLSALSNVRLDNFVYTLECLQAARARLAPDGALIMYYMVASDYIELRLAGMLTRAFEQVPLVLAHDYTLFNRAFLAGPGFDHRNGDARRGAAPATLRGIEARVELPSDDWPFLYLNTRGVNGFYLLLMAVLGGLAVLGVAAVSAEMRRSLTGGGRPDWEMFLFGLGFLLLEARAVTEMHLVWGGTWLTNAVVFGSILAVVLAATVIAQLRPPSFGVAWLGLATTLLLAYALPVRLLVGGGSVGKLALSALFVGAPIFFASQGFAVLFREREQAGAAFGWNLLGAVAGGLVEFTAMAVGLKALLLVALAAYALAGWLRRGRLAQTPDDARALAD